MREEKTDIFVGVASYYSEKLAQYGPTARGVDWNGEESQLLRFEQLSQIISGVGNFSLNDVGCGYGAFFDFLRDKYPVFSYLGIDLSADMIRSAEQSHSAYPQARFITSATPDHMADYGVASGIFNVRLNYTDAEWREHVERTLDMLNKTSQLGFAFNCLTSYSDADKKKDYLYYADPCVLFDFCKHRYSRRVALLHDYGLYEFTILVRKE